MTSGGNWKNAASVEVGDRILTISSQHIDVMSLAESKKSAELSGQVSMVEAEVVSVEAKQSVLIGFNGLGKDFSVTQPLLVKTEDGITYKNAGEIELGEVLLGETVDGVISETTVESIEKDETETTVYDIRTAPQPWFVTKTFIAIA